VAGTSGKPLEKEQSAKPDALFCEAEARELTQIDEM